MLQVMSHTDPADEDTLPRLAARKTSALSPAVHLAKNCFWAVRRSKLRFTVGPLSDLVADALEVRALVAVAGVLRELFPGHPLVAYYKDFACRVLFHVTVDSHRARLRFSGQLCGATYPEVQVLAAYCRSLL